MLLTSVLGFLDNMNPFTAVKVGMINIKLFILPSFQLSFKHTFLHVFLNDFLSCVKLYIWLQPPFKHPIVINKLPCPSILQGK